MGKHVLPSFLLAKGHFTGRETEAQHPWECTVGPGFPNPASATLPGAPSLQGLPLLCQSWVQSGEPGKSQLNETQPYHLAKHWQGFPAQGLRRIRLAGRKRNFLLNCILRLPWLLQVIARGALGRCCLRPTSWAGLGWAELSFAAPVYTVLTSLSNNLDIYPPI